MTFRKILALILVLSLSAVLPAAACADADRYLEMLEKAEIHSGNNSRLHRILEKAKNGENITLAVIGGSITEGAGAGSYQNCWASCLLRQLRAEYGTGDGLNIGLGPCPTGISAKRKSGSTVKKS